MTPEHYSIMPENPQGDRDAVESPRHALRDDPEEIMREAEMREDAPVSVRRFPKEAPGSWMTEG